jgi:hypothetical protein
MSIAAPQKQNCQALGRKSGVLETEHPFPVPGLEIRPPFPGFIGFPGMGALEPDSVAPEPAWRAGIVRMLMSGVRRIFQNRAFRFRWPQEMFSLVNRRKSKRERGKISFREFMNSRCERI